jgi:glycosyltransferase 2 family protein
LNTIMPERLGELFRAEFLKKTSGLSRVWALTSIVIERLFDGLTVVACLGIGLLLGAATSQDAGILIEVLAVGGILFGLGIFAAFCLAGPVTSHFSVRFPGLSAQMTMAQRGFGILRTRRTLEIAVATLVVYVPDARSPWCIVKAAGLGLSLADTLILVGAVSLSTLVPSGPAFLGPLQFAYALAIEFAGGTRALGIAAATLAQLCVLLPIAIVATGVLVHGSGIVLNSVLGKRGVQ